MGTYLINHIELRRENKAAGATPACHSLSESDAMLQALQAGFFEVFFTRHQIINLLTDDGCEAIRFIPLHTANNNFTLAACTIDRNGNLSANKKNFTSGQGHKVQQASIAGFSAVFQAGDLLRLLSGPDCSGIRLLPGLPDGKQSTLTAVGVDARGFDISGGAGYIQSTAFYKKKTHEIFADLYK